jgi:DNA-binding response OmpR family regulator
MAQVHAEDRSFCRVILLLVHTDEHACRDAADFLEQHGFATISVADGDEALEVAPLVDVIVTDLRVLGPFDGLELIRRLRRMDHSVPIIVLTASQSRRQEALTAGCDVFMRIPCMPNVLIDNIRRVLTFEKLEEPRGC